MTPTELEALILDSNDSWQIQSAFAALDEKERAKLSAAAQKLHSQLHRGKASDAASDQLKRHLASRTGENWRHWNARANRNAKLAVFAVGPLTAAKKRDFVVFHDELPVLERILRDRRPEWIDQWVAFELEQQFTTLDFPTVRNWIKHGVCKKPEVDGYYVKFAWHLMRTGHYGPKQTYVPPLSEQLLDDPELLRDVDGLFRVETNAFNTNSWLSAGAAAHYETWPTALVKLSAAGNLDREHLLRLALEGLRRDLKQNQLSGFHRFYVEMRPADDEIIRHQPDYIELLCHPVGHVAGFAIDMLARVEKIGALDSGVAYPELQTVLASGGKGNATAGLKLIERAMARRKGAPNPAALATVGEALRNAHPDVQAKALDLLEKNIAHLGPSQVENLRELGSFVAASIRERLTLVLSRALHADQIEGTLPAAVGPERIVHSRSRETFRYSPLSDDVLQQRILDQSDVLAPIGSVDELIDTVFHLVEVVESPDQVERMIDAISRFAHDRPRDFDGRVAPLLHRMQSGGTGSNGLNACRIGVGLALLDLLHTWATGRLYRTDGQRSQYVSQEDAFVPIIAHLRAITARVARRENRLLLAAPTHKGGWIDPEIWVDRLVKIQHLSAVAASMDFRLSLLRLAPDNRVSALRKVGSLTEPLRKIVSFALGADVTPQRVDRNDYAAWITAARCRAPERDWAAEFAPLALDDPWPDGLRPATHQWQSTHKAGQFEKLRWKHAEISFSVMRGETETVERPKGFLSKILRASGARTATDWNELPSAALCRRMEANRYWTGDLNTTWVAQWLYYIWPQNPQSAYMTAASKLAKRMDENSSNWTPGFGYFNALFQNNRPWGEGGHLVACLGLVGKDADAKGLSVDALIEGIDGKRFDPRMWAAVMARLCDGEWIKFNRLGESLLKVAQISPLHAFVISEALQAWLPNFDLAQKNAYHVLEVLVEAKAITGLPLHIETRDALRKFTGAGKVAKLAGQLQGAT